MQINGGSALPPNYHDQTTNLMGYFADGSPEMGSYNTSYGNNILAPGSHFNDVTGIKTGGTGKRRNKKNKSEKKKRLMKRVKTSKRMIKSKEYDE